ncbi:PREDICTED: cadherin-5 [Chrysochloris asiatica]|uniref:Cadherin-5 n=1 Tax=Chrysochloris asiatica TaxID=185453 RepID=A0A9B0TLL5_CHRAS|nr:PREDICTED: cadherin-5 [Chrysochloris asiatica]
MATSRIIYFPKEQLREPSLLNPLFLPRATMCFLTAKGWVNFPTDREKKENGQRVASKAYPHVPPAECEAQQEATLSTQDLSEDDRKWHSPGAPMDQALREAVGRTAWSSTPHLALDRRPDGTEETLSPQARFLEGSLGLSLLRAGGEGHKQRLLGTVRRVGMLRLILLWNSCLSLPHGGYVPQSFGQEKKAQSPPASTQTLAAPWLTLRICPSGKMQTLRMVFIALGICLGLLATSIGTTDVAQLDMPSKLPSHQRQKRDWIWNQMHIAEEKTAPLPHYVGKIKSSVIRKNAKYLLKGESAGKVFKVNEDTGDVYAYERLDREKTSEYHLTALIVDKDTNKNLESPSSFTIKVHDVNDNWPVFPYRVFNASVPELSTMGTSVIRLTAVDADDPTVSDHASVTYQVLKGDDVFGIDDSGVIFTKTANLDRETQAKYEIVVEARDAQGLHGESGTATVLVTLQDVNDNFPIFTQNKYTFAVPEDIRVGSPLGSLFVEDPDEPQNRMTKYSIVQGEYKDTFTIETVATHNEGIIKPIKPLDYERIQHYSFTIEAMDPTINLRYLDSNSHRNTARIFINVTDVDEPPVFQKPFYHFQLRENQKKPLIGSVLATDPDAARRGIGYAIRRTSDKGHFFRVTKQGNIYNEKELDREIYPWYNLTVEAKELDSSGNPTDKESIVQVHIEVLDENDNAPEFAQPYEPKVCENAASGQVVARISAIDKDITPQDVKFRFSLRNEDSNFTLTDNRDNTANITVKYGQFDRARVKIHYLPVLISDNGKPSLTSTNTLAVAVCKCNEHGEFTFCEEAVAQVGVSVQALVAIFLCILTIAVITLLIFLRRRLRKQARAHGKSVPEIHEQLVTYDEEGGGEMDTTSYDVSVLNSVRRGGPQSPRSPNSRPTLYRPVQKPPRRGPSMHSAPGEMAAMIEVKKDEADHDGDGPPYDTLHIYGFEGSESIAESLSSLVTDSSDSDIDYDFLNDWGPRFKMLAELYGSDPREELLY